MSINTLSKDEDQIMFLGTGGGRHVVFNQIRQSGGIWFRFSNILFVIDPGPGALINAIKHKINPRQICCVFLSHRHLDHSADINALIEVMTDGGKRKHGTIIAPYDATEIDPVILKYNRKNFNLINTKENTMYNINGVLVHTKYKHKHPVETYGAIFSNGVHNFAYIPDTLYFDELPFIYQADTVIVNTVFKVYTQGFWHLAAYDMYKFLDVYKPKKLIITHFGMSFLKSKPWEIVKEIKKNTDVDVVAAYDNMVVDFV